MGGMDVLTARDFAQRFGEDTGLYTVKLFDTREQWLEGRRGHLGASDAYKVLSGELRRLLFDEMTGRREHEDLSGNELVQRGVKAEPLVRQLIAVENPDWDVYDGTGMIFYSKRYPFASCSLDCIMVSRKTGEIVDVELKECPWSRKWKGEYAPDGYQTQLFHQHAVTGFSVALHPRIYLRRDDGFSTAFERSYEYDVEDASFKAQVAELMEEERKFVQMVESGNYRPMLALPSVF